MFAITYRVQRSLVGSEVFIHKTGVISYSSGSLIDCIYI